MDQDKKATGGLEWRVTVPDGSTKVVLVPESRLLQAMKDSAAMLVMKLLSFFKKSWEIGADDPRKFVHCLKVGMTLSVASLFYYMRPLYQGFGGNAMWAVMTVVVVFENTVGATLHKSLNRIFGTTLAGFLAIGFHWVATIAATSSASVSLMEIIPAATLVSLLIDIAARIEAVGNAVKELANMAKFGDSYDDNSKKNQSIKRIVCI